MSDYELVLEYLNGKGALKKSTFPIENKSFINPDSEDISGIVLGTTKQKKETNTHFVDITNAFENLWPSSGYLTIAIGPGNYVEVIPNGDKTIIESLNGSRNSLPLNGHEPDPLFYQINQRTYSGSKIKVELKTK